MAQQEEKKFNYYRDKIVKRSKLLADDNYTQFGLRYFKKNILTDVFS